MIPFHTITHEEREEIVGFLWGPKIQRYRTPIRAGVRKLLSRMLLNRCVLCGRNKIQYGRKGLLPVFVCPVHGLNPGGREQDHPVNPNH